MVLDDDAIGEQLAWTLDRTDFAGFGAPQRRASQDVYTVDELELVIHTDCLGGTTVPFKGEVVGQIAAHWLEQVEDLTPNPIENFVDPRVMLTRPRRLLPFAVQVVGYLCGSVWQSYAAGGSALAPGLPYGTPLPEPVLRIIPDDSDTPLTQEAARQHGLPSDDLEAATALAQRLYQRANDLAGAQGWVLAEARYRLGWLDNSLAPAPDLHAPEHTCYWRADELEAKDDIDAEHLDRFYPPRLLARIDDRTTDAVRKSLARVYLELGEALVPELKVHPGAVRNRLSYALSMVGLLA